VTVEAEEDRRTLVAPGLTVAFARSGDRWIHALWVGDDGETPALVATSVESEPGRDDPRRVVSPVYQEIQPHPVAHGECALLTGQSTPHHFSAVVTAASDGDDAVVTVDVADRCRGSIEVLAATYLVPFGSSDLSDADSEHVAWERGALGRGRLEFRALGETEVVLAEAGRRGTRVQALARLVPSTHTHRLLYSWRWTPSTRKEATSWTS
jgi:hypothetical protein